MRSPLLDALEHDRTPRLVHDLLPCHPDFVDNQPTADDLASALEKWASDWGTGYVVVDTHPGESPRPSEQ